MTTSISNSNTGDVEKNKTEYWYQEKFVWLVFALPLSAVIAGLTTVWIAFSGADSLVKDNYYKEGLAINKNQEKFFVAYQNGVEAEITLRDRELQLHLDQGQARRSESLTLFFTHPTLAKQDFHLQARIEPSQRRAKLVLALPKTLQGNWRVSLSPGHQEWQLEGLWTKVQNHSKLVLLGTEKRAANP